MRTVLTTMRIDQTGKSLEAIVDAYRSLGVIAIRNFFSPPRIRELAKQADDLLAKYSDGQLDSARIAYRPAINGGRIFERFDPVCDIAPAYEAVANEPRIVELAEGLIGGKSFLLKDKLLYKLQGDKGYALHQDYSYYDLSEEHKDQVATIAIAIDDVSQEDGGLTFAVGCHDEIQPAPLEHPKDVDPSAITGAKIWEAVISKGSLIAFHGLTPHSSGANRSPNARRVLYLTYSLREFSHLRKRYYEMRVAASRS